MHPLLIEIAKQRAIGRHRPYLIVDVDRVDAALGGRAQPLCNLPSGVVGMKLILDRQYVARGGVDRLLDGRKVPMPVDQKLDGARALGRSGRVLGELVKSRPVA